MFSSNTTQVSDGGYQISRSLRFNSADSAYLNRTPASATNRKTWTYSAWVKRSKSGDFRTIFSAATDTSNLTIIRFKDDDKIEVRSATAGSTVFQLVTTQVFRDYSAWYHFVLAVDTTNATGGDRVRLYVNGSEVTTFDTDTIPTQNADSWVNNNILHEIARQANNASNYYQDGYMTEMYLIDGSQLTPSSFGETNAQTGVWQPKAYSGSYGTNGFYLNFSDNSNTTAATLGKDYSGNGNNWTPNNFSVTAGAGNDSLVDSPTSYGADTGVGGTVRGNYCTLNPLRNNSNYITLSNGNLEATNTVIAGGSLTSSTFGLSSGKWYWEVTANTSGEVLIGVENGSASLSQYLGQNSNGWGYDNLNGNIYNGSGSVYGSTFTTNDVIGVAVDVDTNKIWFAKNGTWQNSGSPTGGTNPAFSNLTSTVLPAVTCYDANSKCTFNFGQRPFAYTAPSGYKALCTQNLPTPTIGATSTTLAGKYFNPVLYTGNSSSLSVTGVGFQPDWTWLKARSAAYTNLVTDAVRGAGKSLYTNATDAETTNDSNGYLSSFNSDGFSLSSGPRVNANGINYVAWNWKANGAGSTNTAGSITSTVSANTTSGFSIVTYTGNETNATVGHGLGSAPKMIIVKSRGSDMWPVYHSSLGAFYNLALNTTAASAGNNFFRAAEPTSSIFYINNAWEVNKNTVGYVAYCFAEVAGYSKFGSFVGNGSSDGVFVYTGFRPAFVLIKQSSGGGGHWSLKDSARSPSNVALANLFPNLSNAETSEYDYDILSNGFKLRTTSITVNASGETYIYACFAQNPFKTSLAR